MLASRTADSESVRYCVITVQLGWVANSRPVS